MALQSSGPISLGNIQTEFSGSAPTSLSEYYYTDVSGYTVYPSTYVKNNNGGKIPAFSSPRTINKFSNYYGATSVYYWDTGFYTVLDTGVTSKYIPTQTDTKTTDTFMTAHSGGWGQSAEDGQLYWTSDNATTPTRIITLSEGSNDIIPAGKALYSVSTTNVETVATFGNQSQTSHWTYIEIVGVNNLRYFYSDGAPANADNPTRFKKARMWNNYSRASVLASMGANDRYYCIK